MEKSATVIRQIYSRPEVEVIELHSTLLAVSPDVGGEPHIIPPDEDDDDTDLEG
mgnify:FL=1